MLDEEVTQQVERDELDESQDTESNKLEGSISESCSDKNRMDAISEEDLVARFQDCYHTYLSNINSDFFNPRWNYKQASLREIIHVSLNEDLLARRVMIHLGLFDCAGRPHMNIPVIAAAVRAEQVLEPSIPNLF
jgi:hypothetical protein